MIHFKFKCIFKRNFVPQRGNYFQSESIVFTYNTDSYVFWYI